MEILHSRKMECSASSGNGILQIRTFFEREGLHSFIFYCFVKEFTKPLSLGKENPENPAYKLCQSRWIWSASKCVLSILRHHTGLKPCLIWNFSVHEMLDTFCWKRSYSGSPGSGTDTCIYNDQMSVGIPYQWPNLEWSPRDASLHQSQDIPKVDSQVVENHDVLGQVQKLSKLPGSMPPCVEKIWFEDSRVQEGDQWDGASIMVWVGILFNPVIINGNLIAQWYLAKILELVAIPFWKPIWRSISFSKTMPIIIQCILIEILQISMKSICSPGQRSPGHMFHPMSTFRINWKLPSAIVITHQGIFRYSFSLLWRNGITSPSRKSRLINLMKWRCIAWAQ